MAHSAISLLILANKNPAFGALGAVSLRLHC